MIHIVCRCGHNKRYNIANNYIQEQDAREAIRVVFFCTYKAKFLMNIFKYCFKNYIKLHEFANCNSANYDVKFLTMMMKIVIP